MTTFTNLKKGLLATVALGFFATGTAAAQANNFTAATTPVDNTFTLSYEVNGAAQPEINNNDAPTRFLVDRLVDLTVTNVGGDTTVAPGQEDATLTFTLTNDGNDEHAYFLDIVNAIATGDNFDPTAGTPTEITYVDTAGTTVIFDPADETKFPRLLPDETITITVIQDIPAGTVDTNTGDIILVADTRRANDGDVAIIADVNGINELNGTDNVLLDAEGTAPALNGGLDDNTTAPDGAHSALGTYIIAEAEVDGEKTVDVFSEDGSGCAAIPGTAPAGVQYSIPGACVEYRITVTNNDADRAATGIVVEDILPAELTFVAAAVEAGGDFDGTETVTSCGTGTAAANCQVILSGGTLPVAPSATVPAEGVLIIRALIK